MVAKVSDKHRYIFIHVPKTAGTSIRNQIESYPQQQWSPDTRIPKQHAKFLWLERYFTKDGKSIKDFLVFTCIRKPEDRLFSHWFGHVSSEYKSFIKSKYTQIDTSTVKKSFNEWMKSGYLDLLKKTSEYKFIENPYYKWLKGKSGTVRTERFYFLIFEKLEIQWPEFVSEFRNHVNRIPNKKKYIFKINDDLPVENSRASSLYKKDNIRRLYDKESWEIFVKHNSKDIELYEKVLYADKLKRKKKH